MSERDGRNEISEDQIPDGIREEILETIIKESEQAAPPMETMERAYGAPGAGEPEDDLPPMDQDETTKGTTE